MKAEELAKLADKVSLIYKDTQHSVLFSAIAAELRRLAALEQAAEPVAVFKEDKSFGHVEFIPFQGPPLKEGDKLYTHPAPRKPMTQGDMRKLTKEHFDNDVLTGDDFRMIRAVERFHQIEDKPC